MCIDKDCHYLATADVDGHIKTWDILEYCVKAADDVIIAHPRQSTLIFYTTDIKSSLTLQAF